MKYSLCLISKKNPTKSLGISSLSSMRQRHEKGIYALEYKKIFTEHADEWCEWIDSLRPSHDWLPVGTPGEEEVQDACLGHNVHCPSCQLLCRRWVARLGTWPQQRWSKHSSQVVERHLVVMFHFMDSVGQRTHQNKKSFNYLCEPTEINKIMHESQHPDITELKSRREWF